MRERNKAQESERLAEDATAKLQGEQDATNAAKNDAIAQKAEAEKQKQQAVAELAEVQEKERQRAAAEAAVQSAQSEITKKNMALSLSKEQLVVALTESHKNEQRAKALQRQAEDAERNAKTAQSEALVAKDAAVKSAADVAALLKNEQDRVKKLQAQIGSPIVDELK